MRLLSGIHTWPRFFVFGNSQRMTEGINPNVVASFTPREDDVTLAVRPAESRASDGHRLIPGPSHFVQTEERTPLPPSYEELLMVGEWNHIPTERPITPPLSDHEIRRLESCPPPSYMEVMHPEKCPPPKYESLQIGNSSK